AMATELSKGLVGTIVQVTAAPIEFADHGKDIHVAAAEVALDVSKELSHDPTCGAMQWFHPLASVDQATIGVAQQHAFTGSGLGARAESGHHGSQRCRTGGARRRNQDAARYWWSARRDRRKDARILVGESAAAARGIDRDRVVSRRRRRARRRRQAVDALHRD